MKPVICITEQEFSKGRDIFTSWADFTCRAVPADESSLAEAVREHHAFAVIVGVDNYNDQLYRSLPRGGVLARFGVGHDGVDKDRASEVGVIVTNTPGVLDDSVAEYAIWLMGALARRVSVCAEQMKKGQWRPVLGCELRGKRLLLLGCGSIGCKVGRIAARGLGMEVWGYDVATLDAEQLRRDFGISRLSNCLDDMIGQADVVSIHLPSLPTTRHFVNAEFLGKMKRGAFVLNTARGAILDENALYDFVREGRIGGAGLDVFEREPYEPVNPDKDLRSLELVILTPHIASSSVEACQRMARRCMENIRAVKEGSYDKADVLNPSVLTQF